MPKMILIILFIVSLEACRTAANLSHLEQKRTQAESASNVQMNRQQLLAKISEQIDRQIGECFRLIQDSIGSTATTDKDFGILISNATKADPKTFREFVFSPYFDEVYKDEFVPKDQFGLVTQVDYGELAKHLEKTNSSHENKAKEEEKTSTTPSNERTGTIVKTIFVLSAIGLALNYPLELDLKTIHPVKNPLFGLVLGIVAIYYGTKIEPDKLTSVQKDYYYWATVLSGLGLTIVSTNIYSQHRKFDPNFEASDTNIKTIQNDWASVLPKGYKDANSSTEVQNLKNALDFSIKAIGIAGIAWGVGKMLFGSEKIYKNGLNLTQLSPEANLMHKLNEAAQKILLLKQAYLYYEAQPEPQPEPEG